MRATQRYSLAIALAMFGLGAHATERSQAAKLAFVKLHACPTTGLHKLPCPGRIIDHKKALDCGGKDVPENMQWQTIAAAKAKDKWERNGAACKHRTNAK